MKFLTPATSTTRPRALLGAAAAVTTLAIPTASAADIPLLGSPDLGSGWALAGLALVAVAAASFFGVRAVTKHKWARKSPLAVLGVGALLISMAPGGALAGFGGAAQEADAATAVEEALSNDGELFSLVDVTVITREEYDNDAVVSTEVRWYDASKGYTDRQMMEEAVNPLYTKTTDGTSAEATLESLPALDASGALIKYHVVVDKAAYYNRVYRDVTYPVEKPPLSTAQSGIPALQTLLLKPIGDFDTAELATTYNVNSAQLTYSLDMKNSDTDGFIIGAAAKLTAATMTNIVFDNVATGAPCEAVDVSGTTYIKYTGDMGYGPGVIGPSGFATCNILLTTSAATSDFGVALDDLFLFEGATAFNSHGNIRDMTAESEVNVADGA